MVRGENGAWVLNTVERRWKREEAKCVYQGGIDGLGLSFSFSLPMLDILISLLKIKLFFINFGS